VFLGLNQTVQYFSNEGLGVPAGIRMPRGGELIAFSKSTFSKSNSMSPAIALGDIGWITDNTPEPFPFLFEIGNADIPRTVSFQEENEVLPYLAWVSNLMVYKYCPNYDRIMEATLTGPPDHCHGFWAFHVKAKNRNYTIQVQESAWHDEVPAGLERQDSNGKSAEVCLHFRCPCNGQREMAVWKKRTVCYHIGYVMKAIIQNNNTGLSHRQLRAPSGTQHHGPPTATTEPTRTQPTAPPRRITSDDTFGVARGEWTAASRTVLLARPASPEPTPTPVESAYVRRDADDSTTSAMGSVNSSVLFRGHPDLGKYQESMGNVRDVFGGAKAHALTEFLIRQATALRLPIWLACFTFDLDGISDRLCECARAGIIVKIYTDKRQATIGSTKNQSNQLHLLQAAGVRVWALSGFQIYDIYARAGREVPRGLGAQHAKWCRVGNWMVHGSANWTTSSQCNHELDTLLELSQHGVASMEETIKTYEQNAVLFTRDVEERSREDPTWPRSGSRDSRRRARSVGGRS
jgi:hypothetical protein